MSDTGLHARLAELDRLPLDAHPHVLDEVREHIESELDELRRRVPSAQGGSARPAGSHDRR